MAQQTGHSEVGIQTTGTMLGQLLIVLGYVDVAQFVEGERPISILLNFSTIFKDELLELIDGPISREIIGNKQLVASLGTT